MPDYVSDGENVCRCHISVTQAAYISIIELTLNVLKANSNHTLWSL